MNLSILQAKAVLLREKLANDAALVAGGVPMAQLAAGPLAYSETPPTALRKETIMEAIKRKWQQNTQRQAYVGRGFLANKAINFGNNVFGNWWERMGRTRRS